MPPGTSEVKHYHNKSRQFFFILSGVAAIQTDKEKIILKEYEGIEILPGTPHKIANDSTKQLNFIVVSQPESHGDRVVLED